MSIQTTREYVNSCRNDTMLSMTSVHVEYENVSSIGDIVLHTQTEKYLKQNDKPVTLRAMWMDRVMHDVYRRIALNNINLQK